MDSNNNVKKKDKAVDIMIDSLESNKAVLPFNSFTKNFHSFSFLFSYDGDLLLNLLPGFFLHSHCSVCLSINNLTISWCYCFCRNDSMTFTLNDDLKRFIPLDVLCISAGWESGRCLQRCGCAIFTSYCLISHWASCVSARVGEHRA